jgi:hypothetical protein
MEPLICNKQLVTLAPCDPARLEIGDIVLVRVSGNILLHLVSGLDRARRRVQISNNRGKINGWAGYDKIVGICLAVEGVPRPGATLKTATPETPLPVEFDE